MLQVPATSTDQPCSDFGGRVVCVVVGPDREEFLVHSNRLIKTAFFGKHGYPQSAPHIRIIPGQSARASDEVKDEQDANGMADSAADLGGAGQAVEKTVDYVLDVKDHDAAKAFRVFVEALYNEEPSEIKDRDSIKTALKAYRYSRVYEAWVLQNRIVERFRQHYLTHKVKMDELQWMIKTFGDSANKTPLTRYLFEQIAHDISTRGFQTFSNDNGYLRIYLTENSREARLALFAIVARHASDRRHPDPAEGRNEWRVLENGPTAGEWVPEPFTSD